VYAVGTWHNGRRRQLLVFSDTCYVGTRQDATPDKWVALGESKIADAINVLAEMDKRYEDADVIMARAWDRCRALNTRPRA
jgi:hypothetical protein